MSLGKGGSRCQSLLLQELSGLFEGDASQILTLNAAIRFFLKTCLHSQNTSILFLRGCQPAAWALCISPSTAEKKSREKRESERSNTKAPAVLSYKMNKEAAIYRTQTISSSGSALSICTRRGSVGSQAGTIPSPSLEMNRRLNLLHARPLSFTS